MAVHRTTRYVCLHKSSAYSVLDALKVTPGVAQTMATSGLVRICWLLEGESTHGQHREREVVALFMFPASDGMVQQPGGDWSPSSARYSLGLSFLICKVRCLSSILIKGPSNTAFSAFCILFLYLATLSNCLSL